VIGEPLGKPTAPPAAVVLAGGFGTRLRGVLSDLPKPMAPVLGRPFVEWIILSLRAAGVNDFVLSTGYLAEKIASHFEHQCPPGTRVQCIEEDSPLGTAGGFIHAATSSGLHPTVWLVCNGDSAFSAPLEPAFAAMADPFTDGVVLSLWQNDASRYGSLDIAADDLLRGFVEKRPGAAWINAGVYLFRSSLLSEFPTSRPLSFEVDVFPHLLASGKRFRVVRIEGNFLDIGLPESLALADGFIEANAAAFQVSHQK